MTNGLQPTLNPAFALARGFACAAERLHPTGGAAVLGEAGIFGTFGHPITAVAAQSGEGIETGDFDALGSAAVGAWARPDNSQFRRGSFARQFPKHIPYHWVNPRSVGVSVYSILALAALISRPLTSLA
jgi:hypothetical protein